HRTHPNGDTVATGTAPPRKTFDGCRAYIAYTPDRPADGAEDIAAALARLRERTGATVVVAWPAVAGKDCYDADPGASVFVRSIRTALAKRNIPVLGDPRDSAFPEDAVLDTYYHVKAPEAAIRTQRLIAALAAAGVVEPRPADTLVSTAELARRALDRLWAEQTRDDIAALTTLADGRYPASSAAFENRFALATGWSETEPWGVWSLGGLSTLWLKPAPIPCRIRFDSMMFGGPQSLVSVGGAAARLETGAWIELPAAATPLKIVLRHRHVASPRDMRLSADDRPIKYGLKAIDVRCGGG
ncbi:MAG: hypothetical protein KIT16_20685, partial [Rhodospirillaceae bacterium]|nr:hypothetical protein [Rhodospirillaceae bacterium]